MTGLFVLLQTLDMIHNLRDAFGELVNENTWMDDTTRGLAKEKVV